jgi:outer membrane protein TolC
MIEDYMKKNTYLLLLLYPLGYLSGQPVKEDLSLKAALEIGLRNNPEIKASFEKIRAARGGFFSAISPPSLEISTAKEYIPTDQGLSKYGEKSITFSQSLEFPTNYFLRGSKSTKDLEIARQEFLVAKIGLISKIKSAYFNALALEEHLEIAEENCAIAQDFVGKSEIRFNVGEGTNLERLTAKVQFTQAENNRATYKNHLSSALGELNFVLGFGMSEAKHYHLTDTLGFDSFNLSLGSLAEKTAESNPSLKVNSLRVDAAVIERSLAWSSLFPNLGMEFFKQKIRDDAVGYYGVSLGFSFPIWFLLDQRGEILETSAKVQSAQFDQSVANNTVYLKTLSAFNELKNEENQVTFYQKEILPQAEEIFRAASRSYEAGEVNYIEFLQAQKTMIDSRSNYIDALLSYNLSIVSIEEAIGTTLPPKGDQK